MSIAVKPLAEKSMTKLRMLASVLAGMLTIQGPAYAATLSEGFQAVLLSPAEQHSVASILKPLVVKSIPPQDQTAEDWIDTTQSFHIISNQNGLRDTYLATLSADLTPASTHDWHMSASFALIDRVTGLVTLLPQHPVMNWNAYEVESIAFRDVRGDGLRSIIIDVQGVTGIGPNGANPFDVYAVYLPMADGTFRLDNPLQERLKSAQSLDDALRISRAFFHTKSH